LFPELSALISTRAALHHRSQEFSRNFHSTGIEDFFVIPETLTSGVIAA